MACRARLFYPRVAALPLTLILAPSSWGATQSSQASAGANADSGQIEEVLVSARRRGEERLQDVPIAVSVLSEETLRKAGVTELSEVASRTPSFTFGQQIGNQQEIVIRGIGTLRLTGSAAEPSVGLFIDEVYVGRRGTATPPLFDLERVEVVRGPQGTLYGKNVVGGAVNLLTARPSNETSARVAVSYGQFDAFGGRDLWEGSGYLTGGLSDTVAGRLAVYYRKHDGYSQNTLLNEALDDQDNYALRGSLLFQPSEALDIQVVADFSHNESNGQSRRAVDDPSLPGVGAVVGSGLLSDNVRESDAPWTQWEDHDVAGLTARIDYRLGGGHTLTYLSAVRHGDFSGRYSLVGTQSPPSLTDAANAQREKYTGITQDLRLSSSGDGSALSWVAGLYFLREDTDVVDNSIATTFLSVLGPGSVGDILDGEFIYDQENITKSSAIYGELTWTMSEALSLTVGGRYTYDDKNYRNRSECLDFGAQPDFVFCVAPLGAEVWNVRTSKSWSEFTPRASLDWRAADNALIYVSAARGFKGGGWQGKPGTAAAALFPYDPEIAWTYEMGAKTDWADGRVRANLAVFHTSFDDLQVEQLDDAGLTLIIDNAASARINGVELELSLRPLPRLQLWLSGSYLDSEYRDFTDSAGIDLSGNRLARTPEFRFTGGADYTVPLNDALSLGARVEYQWQDEMPWLVENTVFEDSFGLLDARLALQSHDAQWEVALFGRNLTDELYRVDAIPFLGDVFSRFGAPRSYGVQFTKTF
ncbi:TonB-dependent receptor [Steroidobacter sp. S1-65]|uniref:TonB-dependent receptor n=1 Tax=Steroidobacter gossypii TaxID=2805490 RepID=A0ABS1WR04_9GAMM|nr:TonB-dependent receptor [Steroidobacter gossypii]MBM0103409.1 TonB-dependent receptor [Steroidobacter gossypii]